MTLVGTLIHVNWSHKTSLLKDHLPEQATVRDGKDLTGI